MEPSYIYPGKSSSNTKTFQHPSIKPSKRARPNTQKSRFKTLPLGAAEVVSFFLLPVRIDGLESLRRWLRWYPVCCISLILETGTTWRVNAGDTTQDSLSNVLEDAKDFRLDVTLDGHSRSRMYLKLARALSVVPQVVSLTLQPIGILPFAMDLFATLESTENEHHSIILRLEPELHSQQMFEAAAEMISRILFNDAALKNMDLSYSGICLSSAVITKARMVESLTVGKSSLIYLRLRGTKVDTKAAIQLAKVLETHRTIELIDLSSNPLHDEGVVAIAESVSKNHRLRFLLLAEVEMTSVGGIALAKALSEPGCSLDLLFLQDDELGPEGGRAFAAMLTVNSVLRRAFFDYCEFGAEGCKHFVAAMKQNKTLKMLRLNYNGISQRDAKMLVQLAKEVGALESLVTNDRNELAGPEVGSRWNNLAEVRGQYTMPNHFATNYLRHRIAQKLGPSMDYKTRALRRVF